MRNRSKLAALAAAMLLSIAVSSASARRFQLTSQQYRLIWNLLTFILSPSGESLVSCPVTMEGSFHSRIISKVSGQLIGYVNRVLVGEGCTGGRFRALTETLPWHLQYLTFRGALPSIQRINFGLTGARFLVRTSVECLMGTTQQHPLGLGTNVEGLTGGPIRHINFNEEFLIPLGREFPCSLAGNGGFKGESEVFAQGSTSTRILVSLVQ